MNINGKAFRTIWFDKNIVKIIDQTKLPHQFIVKELKSVKDAILAIKNMEVRGAPLIGATAVLTDASEDWEVLSAITPLEMGVKIRTGDDATAQMSFEDGSSLLMGGNSVISVRSFDYDEEAQSRVLIVDLISGSVAYDIFSDGLSA